MSGESAVKTNWERFKFITGSDGSLPTAPPVKLSYGDPAYWEARYTTTTYEPFDWYVKWEQLKEVVTPMLTPESKIMVLGCGTSTLPADIHAEGFTELSCIDQNETLIDNLAQRYQELSPAIYFEACDARDLPEDFQGQFNVVLDKALFDGLACAADKKKAVASLLKQVSRVLKPGGTYICISWAKPAARVPLLLGPGGVCEGKEGQSERYGWKILHRTIPRPMPPPNNDPKGGGAELLKKSAVFDDAEFVYHIYICSKLGKPEDTQKPDELASPGAAASSKPEAADREVEG